MPRLSIVIPVVGDSQQLDDTLVSVLENRPADCEIVVVHNQPYHDPYNLGDEVRFVEAAYGAGMVECCSRGLAASQSPIIQVLTCGVDVCAGWTEAALRHFNEPTIGAVCAVVVKRDDRERVVSAGWGYRTEGAAWRLGEGNEPGKIALVQPDLCGPDMLSAFYRRSAIEAVGGFSSWTGPVLAGVDLALALRDAGFRCVLEPQCLALAAPSVVRVESALARGRHAERLFWRWASCPGWCTSLVGHVALLAGQCVIALWRPSLLLELAGRLSGSIETVLSKRNRPGIKRVHAVLAEPSAIVGRSPFSRVARNDARPSRVA